MPVQIHGKEYITVAERVQEAHKDCKALSITTEVLPNGGNVVVKATVVNEKGTYTGISSANPNKFIEKTNPYEVAETSAVGRALGFAGYGAVEGIASADEMIKSQAQTEEDPDWIREDVTQPTVEKPHVCMQHGEPISMFKGKSKSTGKEYWWHKNTAGQICFGTGYKD